MSEHGIIKVPPRVVRATFASLGFAGLPELSTVQLEIRADASGFRLRSFGAYLHLVDRFYGRQDTRGLRSYAQRPWDQLELSEIRLGSIELVVSAGLDFVSQHHLVLTWILLRGIPHAGRAISQAIGHFASAYHDYEAGRLARAQRKGLEDTSSQEGVRRALRATVREFLETDPHFRDMDPGRRAELARLLAEAYLAEDEQLRAAREFAQTHVHSVALRLDGNELP